MNNTDSMTNLLKLHRAGISAVRANKALVDRGLLEEKERPSAKYPGKIKKFKVLTEHGLKYGNNVENSNSPGQTTPYYFIDNFEKLLQLIRDQIEMDTDAEKPRQDFSDDIPF